MAPLRVLIKSPPLPGLCMAALADSSDGGMYRSAPSFIPCDATDTYQWWSILPVMIGQSYTPSGTAQ